MITIIRDCILMMRSIGKAAQSPCSGSLCTNSTSQSMCSCLVSRQLTKTGGGSGLQADPATELPIPFTITATQNAPKTVGYVAGKVNVQNSGASSNTISAVTVTISGQQAQTIPVSNCASATLQAQGTTSCTFNLTNPAAPAAGTVTAAVTFAAGTPAVTSSGKLDRKITWQHFLCCSHVTVVFASGYAWPGTQY